jgi:hypothetical protein
VLLNAFETTGRQFRNQAALPETHELPWAKAQRNNGLEDFQLLAGVSCNVNLAGLGSFVAEPKGHLPDIARGLQDVDAAGVAKHMG